jgi:hypothetical protein
MPKKREFYQVVSVSPDGTIYKASSLYASRAEAIRAKMWYAYSWTTCVVLPVYRW